MATALPWPSSSEDSTTAPPQDFHLDHAVALSQADADDPHARPPGGADVVLGEGDALAVARGEEEVVAPRSSRPRPPARRPPGR